MEQPIWVASEDGTAGSVMAKAERISPPVLERALDLLESEEHW